MVQRHCMETISFDDFKKLDLRVAKVLLAERVEGSDKLLRLEIELGEEKRQLVAGIGKVYSPENIIGKEIIIVANLEPRLIMGLESKGMLLAASSEAGPVLLIPEHEVESGTMIR